jgi:sugar lactone lactonase YvrE
MKRWTVRGRREFARVIFSLTDPFQPYLDTKCGLGEGPFYNEQRNELRFVVCLPNLL